jgi:hypothetical protein
MIDAFATTLLLTNIKFQSVSFDLMTVTVYHLNNTGHWTYSTRLFYDATVPYFGAKHLPYAIAALTVTTLFVLLPFRCFQKLLNLLPFSGTYILHTFVDSFYGSFKDATEPGTRDCRWFASLFFISHFCFGLAFYFLENVMIFPAYAIILTSLAILFITVQPFKETNRHFTNINVFFILLLALLFSFIIGLGQSWFKLQELVPIFVSFIAIAATLPLLYISAIVLHWIYSQRRFLGETLQQESVLGRMVTLNCSRDFFDISYL